MTYTLETAFGSVTSLRPDLTLDEQVRQAKEERAARAVRTLANDIR